MTDADVTKLNNYAGYLTSWAGAGDSLANDVSALPYALAANAVQTVQQLGAAIGPQAKVNLYSAMLSQAASDLNQATSGGGLSAQFSGGASALQTIAAWLNTFGGMQAQADSAVTTITAVVSGNPAAGSAVTDIDNQLTSIYGAMTPGAVATDLQRIAGRFQTMSLNAGGNGTSGGGGAAHPPSTTLAPAAASSSARWIVGGIAAAGAAIAALWWAKRKRGRRG